jgi:hypothetical protein
VLIDAVFLYTRWLNCPQQPAMPYLFIFKPLIHPFGYTTLILTCSIYTVYAKSIKTTRAQTKLSHSRINNIFKTPLFVGQLS